MSLRANDELLTSRLRCGVLDAKLVEVTDLLIAALDREAEAAKPKKLTTAEVNEKAMRLRMIGLSYSAISKVIYEYHGVKLTEKVWSLRCRAQGAPGRARGSSFGSELRAQLEEAA